MSLSKQEIVRRNKLDEIKKFGLDPYPSSYYKISASMNTLIKFYEVYKEHSHLSIAGRLMRRRIMGRASFAELQDHSGSIQIYINIHNILEEERHVTYNILFKKILDLGDIIGVEGFLFKTRLGEITLHVQKLILLSKALRPLPQVKIDETGKMHDAFSDPEQRYRMRYLDLILNKSKKNIFLQRNRIINTIRESLNQHGYIEVETPILQFISGGGNARPFTTHHSALDLPLYLRIANELYLKRLIVGGFEGVYEFAKDFRNEGMDRTHNPEFTMLELYIAYKDYYWMMDFTEEFLEKLCLSLYNTTSITLRDQKISFKQPFPRVSMYDAIATHTGFDVTNMNEKNLRNVCQNLNIEVDKTMGRGKIIEEIFGKKCEENYIQPTFIIDHPIEISPLTKQHRNKQGLSERFELYINGKEIANASSELNDPIEQLQRFKEQMTLLKQGDHEAMKIDYSFLRALEFGMPPTAGIGIGIDRLVMILTDQPSIQEVLFFPQMRPERKY